MQKCKSLGILNDARDNAHDLYNRQYNIKHKSKDDEMLLESYKNEMDALQSAIDNPVEFAMDILRHEMKDKSEGELYHGWMCNIKWAVFDAIKNQSPIYKHVDSYLQNGCEKGAESFLDRLLNY